MQPFPADAVIIFKGVIIKEARLGADQQTVCRKVTFFPGELHHLFYSEAVFLFSADEGGGGHERIKPGGIAQAAEPAHIEVIK
ncbi:hypothetical protein D9M69_679680 [compost metagenome]